MLQKKSSVSVFQETLPLQIAGTPSKYKDYVLKMKCIKTWMMNASSSTLGRTIIFIGRTKTYFNSNVVKVHVCPESKRMQEKVNVFTRWVQKTFYVLVYLLEACECLKCKHNFHSTVKDIEASQTVPLKGRLNNSRLFLEDWEVEDLDSWYILSKSDVRRVR